MLFAIVPLNSNPNPMMYQFGQLACTPAANPEVTSGGIYDGCNGWNVVDNYSCNSSKGGGVGGAGCPGTGVADGGTGGWGYAAQGV